MSENTTDQAQTRNRRRVIQGTVSSDTMDKTITVRVERAYRHPKYGKIVRRHEKYHAHDEAGVANIGDEVELISIRPLSKLKRWRLSKVLVQAITDSPETNATNPEAVRVAAAEEESA